MSHPACRLFPAVLVLLLVCPVLAQSEPVVLDTDAATSPGPELPSIPAPDVEPSADVLQKGTGVAIQGPTSPSASDSEVAEGQDVTFEPASVADDAAQSPPALEEERLRFRGALDWFFSLEGALPAYGQLNPQNRVLRVPQGAVSNELRPNLRFELGTLQLVVRPRFSLVWIAAQVGQEMDFKTWRGTVDWPELYGSWRLNDALAISYGLQNYQWGPGETLNPTNTIIHRPYNRNILTLVRGKNIVRVNVSYGRRLSVILLVEPMDNGEAPYAAGTKFEPKVLLRTELTSKSGSSYLGLAGGKGGPPSVWFGEYASLALSDGLSVYLDARHQNGSSAWYPAPYQGESDSQSGFVHKSRSGLQTLGLVGARYSWESGVDLRFEYIHNDLGYTNAEAQRATQAVLARVAGNPEVLGFLTAPGLDLPGRKYGYASIRIPELAHDDALTLDFRVLKTLSDRSAATILNVEWIGSDACVLFFSAMAALGRPNEDLTRLMRGYVIAGSRYTW